jgi:hypothetical protein
MFEKSKVGFGSQNEQEIIIRYDGAFAGFVRPYKIGEYSGYECFVAKSKIHQGSMFFGRCGTAGHLQEAADMIGQRFWQENIKES